MTTDELKKKFDDCEIAHVVFTKKNGEERHMNASRNWEFLRSVTDELEYVDPTHAANYDAEARGMVRVWDCDNKGWRTINAATVSSFEDITERS